MLKRLLKLILGLFALAMTLLLAVAVYLTLFFNPNQFKPDIERIALEQGGIELQIDGKVSWAIFPWLGFDISDITTRYPGQTDLASLRKAHVSLHLPALASGQMQIRDIMIDGLELHLQRNQQGQVNWLPQGGLPSDDAQHDLTSPLQEEDSSDTPASDSTLQAPRQAAEQETQAEPLSLNISSILISNAQLSYQDLLLDQTLTLSNLEVTASNLTAGERFPADLSFTLQGSRGPEELTATLNLQGDFLLNLQQMQLQAHNLSSRIALSGTALPAPLDITLKSNLERDLRTGITHFNNFKLSLANMQLQGRLVLDDAADASDMPNLTGELTVAPFDLKQFMSALGRPLPDTADPDALRLISVNAAINAQDKRISLSPLVLRVDDTNLAGTLVYSRETRHMNIHLRGDVLDADRYRAAAKNSDPDTKAVTAKAEQTTTPAGYSREPLIELGLLRLLNVDAMLDMQRVIFAGLKLDHLGITVQADKGLINLSRLNADLYEGSIRNSMTLDASGDDLLINSQHAVQAVQLGRLLQDLQGSADEHTSSISSISGQLNADAELSSSGLSPHDLISQLNGRASLSMTDGQVQGFDMAHNLCREITSVVTRKEATPEEAAPEETAVEESTQAHTTGFSNLQTSLRIRNGVLLNDDLNASLDALQINGRGQIDLGAQAMDYRIGMTANSEQFEQSCPIGSALQGKEFPIICAGSFGMPATKLCRPDMSSFTELLRQELEKRLSQKVQEQLSKDAVRNLLQGLRPE